MAMSACAQVQLDPMREYRYCGPPKRNADGTIYRSRAVVRAFKKLYPCPATGKSDGVCPGWAINHTFPLALGGCDAVYNLDWMPTSIKSCARPECRDRWERDYFTEPRGVIVLP
jgi:hypothetical protein